MRQMATAIEFEGTQDRVAQGSVTADVDVDGGVTRPKREWCHDGSEERISVGDFRIEQ